MRNKKEKLMLRKTRSIKPSRLNFIDLFKKKGDGEQWHGDSGYICTYTADKEVLKDVVDAFNNDEKDSNVLHLIIGSGVEKFDDKVGHILTLGLKPEYQETMRTMHAKVCLLKFKNKDSNKICYRLVVTTGNLTKNSLMNDWDLYWYNDLIINSTALNTRGSTKERANLWAAKDFFEKLLQYYPETFVADSKKNDFDFNEFCKELEVIPRSRNLPQFIHSIEEEKLIAQIIRKASYLKNKVKTSSYPYLIVGSGSYGKKKGEENIPHSLIQTVQEIQNKVFNKRLNSCYVAYSHMLKTAVDDKAKDCKGRRNVKTISSGIDFLICPVPEDQETRKSKNLHAKFIFGSFKGPCKPESRTNFEGNFLYLGSGNISSKGLGLNGCPQNIEAGVFLDLTKQKFSFANRNESPTNPKIEEVLPINAYGKWKQTLANSKIHDEDIDKGRYFACPIRYLKLTKERKFQVLRLDNDFGFEFNFQYPVNSTSNPKDGDLLDIKNIDDDKLKKLLSVHLTWKWKGMDGKTHTQSEPILIMDEEGGVKANYNVREYDCEDPFACTLKTPRDENSSKSVVEKGEDMDDPDNDEEKLNNHRTTQVADTDLRVAMKLFESLFRAYLTKIKKENEDWDQWVRETRRIANQNLKQFEVLKNFRVNPFCLLTRKELLDEIIEEKARKEIVVFANNMAKQLHIDEYSFFGWNR